MKLPKSFIPKDKKKVEKKLDSLLEEKKHKRFHILIEGLEEFLKDPEYKKAEYIIGGLKYSKQDIQPFCDKLRYYGGHDYYSDIGIYLSELINQIIKKNETMMLDLYLLPENLNNFGIGFEKGTVIIEGNLGNFTGIYMKGGKIIVKGNIGDFTGYSMYGGEIHGNLIKGVQNVHNGKIYAEELRTFVRGFGDKGKLYKKGEPIWE